MATEITFRRGSTDPTSGSGITLAEPVFNTNLHTFHIGLGYGITAEWVGAPISGLSADIAAGITYKIPTAAAVKNYISGLCFGNTAGGGGGAVSSVSGSGNGVLVSPTTGAVVVSNTGVHSFNGRTGAVQGVSAAVAGTGISVSGATGAVTITNIGVQSFNGLTGAVTGVASIRGLTGAVGITNGTGIGLSVSGQTMTFSNTGVLSINGVTGAVTNVAKTDVDNNFAVGQTINGSVFSYNAGTDRSISINPSTDKITFRNEVTENQLDLYAGGNYNNQVIAFPQTNTTLAGLVIDQTFTGTNTFNAVTNFASGISAAGGVTFSGTFSGATGSFSRLLTASAGISAAGGITLAGTLQGTTASFTGLVSSTVGFSGSGTNITGLVSSFNGLTGAVTGVSRVNGFTGGITFAASTGITFTASAGTITLSTTGGGAAAAVGITGSIQYKYGSGVTGTEYFKIALGGVTSDYLPYQENILYFLGATASSDQPNQKGLLFQLNNGYGPNRGGSSVIRSTGRDNGVTAQGRNNNVQNLQFAAPKGTTAWDNTSNISFSFWDESQVSANSYTHTDALTLSYNPLTEQTTFYSNAVYSTFNGYLGASNLEIANGITASTIAATNIYATTYRAANPNENDVIIQSGYHTADGDEYALGVYIGDVNNVADQTKFVVNVNNSSFDFESPETGTSQVRVFTQDGLGIYGTKPLKFYDEQDPTGYVAFKGPGIASNITWTLPGSDGSANQVLTTNGSGTLSWSTPSGGGSSVTSFNGLTGAVTGVSRVNGFTGGITFAAGTGITFTASAGTITLSTTGGGSKTYAVYTPLNNQPPAANYATINTRNSIMVLEFDAATDESAVFVGVMPEAASLGSGLKIRINWMATSATSGTCRWGVQIERMNTDEDSDSFDTAATAGSTTNGTSGIITTTEITITTIDSVTAGDPFRIKVYRDADGTSGTDDMTGDAQLVSVEVRSAS